MTETPIGIFHYPIPRGACEPLKWIKVAHSGVLLGDLYRSGCVAENGAWLGLFFYAATQDPPGTLPEEDDALASMLPPVSRADWPALREAALTGWQPCLVETEDGPVRRLWHPQALAAVQAGAQALDAKADGALRAARSRLRGRLREAGISNLTNEQIDIATERVREHLRGVQGARRRRAELLIARQVIAGAFDAEAIRAVARGETLPVSLAAAREARG